MRNVPGNNPVHDIEDKFLGVRFRRESYVCAATHNSVTLVCDRVYDKDLWSRVLDRLECLKIFDSLECEAHEAVAEALREASLELEKLKEERTAMVGELNVALDENFKCRELLKALGQDLGFL